MKYLCILPILLGSVLGVVQAGVYKWVDKNGQVHFSDKPTSPSASYVDVKPNVVENDQLNSIKNWEMRRKREDRMNKAEKNREKKLKDKQKKRENQAMQRKCDSSRQMYSKLTWGNRTDYGSRSVVEFYALEENGKIVSEKRKRQKAKELKKFIDSKCGNHPDSRDFYPIP